MVKKFWFLVGLAVLSGLFLIWLYKVYKSPASNISIQPTPTPSVDVGMFNLQERLIKDISSNKADVNLKFSYKDILDDTFEKIIDGELKGIDYKITYTSKLDIDGWKMGGIIINLNNKGGKSLVKQSFVSTMLGRVMEIKNGGEEYLLIDMWTGGAHCCTEVYLYSVDTNGRIISERLDLGNIDVVEPDNFFIKGGDLYLYSYNDDFAYFETSYAESGYMFFPVFYRVTNGKFVLDKNSFKEIYRSLHDGYEIYMKGDNRECFSFEKGVQSPFTALVDRYSLGFMAGMNAQVLEEELVRDWCTDGNKLLSTNDAMQMINKIKLILKELK